MSIESIERKFTSSNSEEVQRITLTREEFYTLMDQIQSCPEYYFKDVPEKPEHSSGDISRRQDEVIGKVNAFNAGLRKMIEACMRFKYAVERTEKV